ncbi:hypothetical protein PFISCL1PPCAC_13094 [Pristionchus fissidentatus]|uniref:Uncharacterized protein n=1 Tax=Pristionchus fissidentatus TaxID=1538716 RepID=A0AAV5VSW4_9BILA|nr:hypothetical protein PFISCL1PPCAC_13094 [Pristionchus fissidentatus]
MVFTHRICCCSATAASKMMAFIAVLMCGWVAINAWFTDQTIFLTIWQNILLVVEILAGIMVFMACSRGRPTWMLPIIAIQANRLLYQFSLTFLKIA